MTLRCERAEGKGPVEGEALPSLCFLTGIDGDMKTTHNCLPGKRGHIDASLEMGGVVRAEWWFAQYYGWILELMALP